MKVLKTFALGRACGFKSRLPHQTKRNNMSQQMKVLIAKLLSPPLFAVGHILSLLMHIKYMHVLYPAYNWFMLASCDIEGWAGVHVMWGVPPDG